MAKDEIKEASSNGKLTFSIDKGNLVGTSIAVAIAVILIVAYIIGSRQPDSEPDAAPSICEQAETC